MTKRELLAQLLVDFSDSCMDNDISVLVVACYKDKSFVPTTVSFVHECEGTPGILLPVMLGEMKINPLLDDRIKCAADASRVDLKVLGLDD